MPGGRRFKRHFEPRQADTFGSYPAALSIVMILNEIQDERAANRIGSILSDVGHKLNMLRKMNDKDAFIFYAGLLRRYYNNIVDTSVHINDKRLHSHVKCCIASKIKNHIRNWNAIAFKNSAPMIISVDNNVSGKIEGIGFLGHIPMPPIVDICRPLIPWFREVPPVETPAHLIPICEIPRLYEPPLTRRERRAAERKSKKKR